MNFRYLSHNCIIINYKTKNYEKQLFGEEYKNGIIDYGILEKANYGTLLLDEVSEIPFEMQSNILRSLIDQKFKRINGTKDISVNVRIISSTSKDLKKISTNKIKKMLEKSIQNEDYIIAAKLRDELNIRKSIK